MALVYCSRSRKGLGTGRHGSAHVWWLGCLIGGIDEEEQGSAPTFSRLLTGFSQTAAAVLIALQTGFWILSLLCVFAVTSS
eukprot:4999375-Amphidinium_carterae.2